jgi:hypothetical protein
MLVDIWSDPEFNFIDMNLNKPIINVYNYIFPLHGERDLDQAYLVNLCIYQIA